MPAAPNTDDDKALTILLEFLRYVERELSLLDAPLHDVRDLVGQAAQHIERKLGTAPP